MSGKRKGGASQTDFAMGDALFLSTYPGYTLALINEMDEEQYMALSRRIPHVMMQSPLGIIARKL